MQNTCRSAAPHSGLSPVRGSSSFLGLLSDMRSRWLCGGARLSLAARQGSLPYTMLPSSQWLTALSCSRGPSLCWPGRDRRNLRHRLLPGAARG